MTDTDDVIVVSEHGIIIRMPCSGINVIGRNTQGVRLMKLDDKDHVVAVAKVVSDEKPTP